MNTQKKDIKTIKGDYLEFSNYKWNGTIIGQK